MTPEVLLLINAPSSGSREVLLTYIIIYRIGTKYQSPPSGNRRTAPKNIYKEGVLRLPLVAAEGTATDINNSIGRGLLSSDWAVHLSLHTAGGTDVTQSTGL